MRLRDVARVSEAPALQTGDALIQGQPGVLLSMSSQFGANTLTVTRAVEQALATLTPELKADGIQVYPALHRPANFIEVALHDISQSLLLAGVLILLVLFAFLRNWRSAAISFLAIPLSLVAAAVVLGRFGFTLNTMTLGGFAVALGVLVDDAIIGIENTLRRLRQNAASEAPQPRLDVIRDATVEIRGPVLYATLVVLVVFLPVLATSGVQGRFVGPLAIAFMLSVLASLGVALTVTPALVGAAAVTARVAGRAALDRGAQARAGALHTLRRSALRAGGRRPRDPVRGHARGAAAAQRTVHARLPRGSLRRAGRQRRARHLARGDAPSRRRASAASCWRCRSSRRSSSSWAAPRAVRTPGARSAASSTSSSSATSPSTRPRPRTGSARCWPAIPVCNVEVVTFLGDRLSESLTGETAQEVINIFGDDLDTLDSVAAAAGDALAKVPGVVDLQVSHVAQTPAMRVTLQPERLAARGLRAQDVLETVQEAYAGATVGQAYAGVRRVDVVLIAPEAVRQRAEQLGRSPSPARSGRCRCARSPTSRPPRAASASCTRTGSGAWR